MVYRLRLGPNGLTLVTTESVEHSISSLAIGDLGGDSTANAPDVAMASGNRVLILHGNPAGAARTRPIEEAGSSNGLQGLVLGRFVPNANRRLQIAILGATGIDILARNDSQSALSDSGPLPERNRRAAAEDNRSNGPHPWTVLHTMRLAPAKETAQPFRRRLSANQYGQLLVTDLSNKRVTIVNPQRRPGAAQRTVQSDGAPAALLSMRLNVMGEPGLVMLTEDNIVPATVPSQPNITYHVTSLIDSKTGNCTPPSGSPVASSCTTLRAAVLASNASAGQDLIVFDVNGTMTLSVAGLDDLGTMGDLDVTDALTIVGNGTQNTILQGGLALGSGIDKVFSFNPLGAMPGFPVSLSGLTIRFGANASNDPIGGDNEGGAFDFDAGFNDGAGC